MKHSNECLIVLQISNLNLKKNIAVIVNKFFNHFWELFALTKSMQASKKLLLQMKWATENSRKNFISVYVYQVKCPNIQGYTVYIYWNILSKTRSQ